MVVSVTLLERFKPDAVQAHINGGGIPKRFHGMFVYLDLQKMAWRGFKEERIIGIVD